jgi:putative flippase GtrA
MILVDLLYNIHFAPFRNYPERGKAVAVFLLSSFLTFMLFGVLIIILYSIFEFRFVRTISPVVSGLSAIICYGIIAYTLNKLYIVNNRDAGEIKFPTLFGVLIPILALGGPFFFAYSAYNFG